MIVIKLKKLTAICLLSLLPLFVLVLGGLHTVKPYYSVQAPQIIATVPADGARNVSLYPAINIFTDISVNWAAVRLERIGQGKLISGKLMLNEKQVTFLPHYAFLPNSYYRVAVKTSSWQNTKKQMVFTFSTIELGDSYWIDVKLGRMHSVTVYKGLMPIRHMLASGGKEGQETPLGIYRIRDRGLNFWSERFGEGASYWLRLKDQYLIHSVPQDIKRKTIEEEHAKLGLPASHGCIRLSFQDAKWFYYTIPEGTLVVIHP
jgi:lipoprotein-anchoring transpeptidase ErfK/SrfK